MRVRIELERETVACWIARAPSVRVTAYGQTRAEAVDHAVSASCAVIAAAIMEKEMRAPRVLTFKVVGPSTQKKRTGARQR